MVTLREVRRMVRSAILRETLGASASGSDTGGAKGFYPYEIERGEDIHGFWYKSPGREPGGDGDPYRAKDAAEYIGQKPPPENPVNAPGEEAAEKTDPDSVMPGEGAPTDGTAAETGAAEGEEEGGGSA